MNYWKNKSLLELSDHEQQHVLSLLTLASKLKENKKNKLEKAMLNGKNVVLIFEKTSTRTRVAFEVACFDQGACCTYIDAKTSQMGAKESVADTACVLGRVYDAIAYRGFRQQTVQQLDKYANIPVYNALTDTSHPTQMLADILTMQEHKNSNLNDISYTYLGDARNNSANSLLLAGALMGMDVRICAPAALQPETAIQKRATELAAASGAKIYIGDDIKIACKNSDFIHSDIWVSMGESDDVWQQRSALLLPYRVDAKIMELTQNQNVKFMHCLPSYHDRHTPTGEKFYEKHALNGIEVDDEVFTSAASLVFAQAENRMHTIKALLIATLSDEF